MTYKRKPRWTHTQTQFLKDHYDVLKDEQIARMLGKTLKSIRKKRENMGIVKECGRGICKPRKDD